ncbi:transposase [Umezawaea beigongshangensis]|uniref:transposase n=1 Tax=Umezawaea beigongshangensis TaxID=2780383 RepID=UPI001E43F8B0|nr:transposase [Umezawaea beigongshangensis]
MDLDDIGSTAQFLICDQDGKLPALFDSALADAGTQVAFSGVRLPRMNAIMERWIRSCRHELLDRTLIWNQRHLLHALRQYEQFYNTHRPHQGINNARPLRASPSALTDRAAAARLRIRQRQRLGGILNQCHRAA